MWSMRKISRSTARAARGAALAFVLLWVFGVGCASVGTRPTSTVPFEVVGGGLFALSVPDLAASTAWYVEKFGLLPTLNIPVSDGAPGIVVLEGAGMVVELQQHAGAMASDASPERRHGIFKVGIVVADVDAALAAVRARGVPIHLGPYPARDDQPANFIIRDNAGTLIQFIGTEGER